MFLATVVAVVAVHAAPVAGGATAEWNIARVGGPLSDPDVTIAVVDTGVEAGHPAFGTRVLDQINIEPGPGDDNGHGTHVAGTAAGGAVNCGRGVSAVGIAPGASILPVRVLDGDGNGTVGGVARGIRAAADRGVEVINLSLGPDFSLGDLGGTNDELADAIEYAWSKGSIPVLAAGNAQLFGFLGSGYGDLDAMVVTATTKQDRQPSYATDVGSAKWGIAAPGGDNTGNAADAVTSAYTKADSGAHQCAALAGTSMAAPHVSGALAILRARGLSPQEAVDRLLATARPLGSRQTYGAGLVDLAAAVEGLSRAGVTTTTTAPSTTEPVSTTAAVTSSAAVSSTAPTTTAPSTSGSISESTSESQATSGDSTTSTTEDRRVGEEAARRMSVPPQDDGQVGGALATAAGLACAALWVAVGRAVLRLRRG